MRDGVRTARMRRKRRGGGGGRKRRRRRRGVLVGVRGIVMREREMRRRDSRFVSG